MSLCVALLIASEFMPVSLLTPIAADLHASAGMAGQAISISGLFAVVASLLIAPLSSRFNRRHVLIALTATMLVSLLLIANAHSFGMLMAARALLGVVIGGFWALSTATVMRIMPEHAVPKALGIIFMGNAVAAAFAAPLGSYLGATIGWRGVFWGMLPLVALTIVWQWRSLPSMPAQGATSLSGIVTLLKRRYVARAMLAVMCMLLAGHVLWAVAIAMIAWGTLNAAMPVAWSTWLSRCIKDAPESGGGLMVAAIQLSIMLGGAAGGVLLDHVSIGATFVGASVLLLASSLVAGRGDRLQP